MEESKTGGEARGWPVAEIAEDQRLVADLLTVHVRDARGRCSGCAVDPKLRPVWPCGPRGLAEDALRPPR